MFASKQLLKTLKPKEHVTIQNVIKATLCHKIDLPPKKVKHWDYDKRAYTYFNCWLDLACKKKFDENSLVIQIEGNVAAGKEDFGRRLANELGMYYLPPFDVESYYINNHGFDYRALNPLLPERLRLCDWEMFHENPTRHSVIHLQQYIFKMRFDQYLRAIRHLFNTGQGVVMSRSPLTEKVFVDAMHKIGWLPKGYLRGDGARFYDWRYRYDYIRNLMVTPILKPHLTIYLDTPVDVCLDRIKKSDDPKIANSNALVPEFLEAIKEAYENDMLERCEQYGHVVTYDYSDRATDDEIRDVVDDLKPLDFSYDYHDTRFQEWNEELKPFWHGYQRRMYTSTWGYEKHFEFFPTVGWWDISGMGDSITECDLKLRNCLFEAHVAGVGKWKDFYSDSRFQNPFKIMSDSMNFKTRLNKMLKVDFV